MLLGLLAVAVALLALPGAASAAVSCNGHTERAESEVEGDFALSYQFGCSDKILGYALTFDQEIGGFEAEVPVLDGQGTATNELMSCEGDIPGLGLGCFGGYSAGGRNIKGTVTLDRDACDEPRYTTYLTVVTGAKGQTAGPFKLGRPQGCKKSSQLAGLIAWIEMLRDEIRAARK
jgi:hypothetical protein